jgi:hypothetical protein
MAITTALIAVLSPATGSAGRTSAKVGKRATSGRVAKPRANDRGDLDSVVRTTLTTARRQVARARPAPTRQEAARARQSQYSRAEELVTRADALDAAILNLEATHLPTYAATANLLRLEARLETARADYSLRSERLATATARAPREFRRQARLRARSRKTGERDKNGYLLGHAAADPWNAIRLERGRLDELKREIEGLAEDLPTARQELADAARIPASREQDALVHYAMMGKGDAVRSGEVTIGGNGRWRLPVTSASRRKEIRAGTLGRYARSSWPGRSYGRSVASKKFARELVMDQKTNRGLAEYSATWGERFDSALAELGEGATILEVGPGQGRAVGDILAARPGVRVVAVDVEDSGARAVAAASKGRARFVKGNVLSVAKRLDGGKAALVMDYNAAIVSEAPGAVMSRYGEVLARDGYLFLALPPAGKSWVYPAAGGTPIELLDYIKRVPGFEVVESGFRNREASRTREDGVGTIRTRYAILRRTGAEVKVKPARQIGQNTEKYSQFGRAFLETE